MRVMVLNDGETYTDALGCTLIEVPDDATDEEISRAAFFAHAHPSAIDRILGREDGTEVVVTFLGRF